jgi:hypothetical protein
MLDDEAEEHQASYRLYKNLQRIAVQLNLDTVGIPALAQEFFLARSVLSDAHGQQQCKPL